jgi:alkaline phosphatase
MNKILNFTLLTVCVISVSSLVKAQNAKTTAKQPNIILFMVDDMGWQDTSVPFYKEQTELNRKYHTPNMERLAAMGVKFTQAYATSVIIQFMLVNRTWHPTLL